MNIKYLQCKFLPSLLTLLAISVFLSLGFWQLNRLNEKEHFLRMLKSGLNNLPIDLKSLSNNISYTKIKMSGHFLDNKNIYLYGRRSMSTEKDGYYLVSPFETDNNKIVMVVRGWFVASYKKNINNIIKNDHNENIVGITLQSEKKRYFVLDNDIKNNVWFTLDLKQISEVLDLKLEDFFVIIGRDITGDTNNTFNDILKPLSINNLINVRNNHLEYAITWFSLAIILAVIFVVYYVNK